MSESAAYIADMSCEDLKPARHCQRQAPYEASLRDDSWRGRASRRND